MATTNKCFTMNRMRKGCDSREENKLVIQNELTNEEYKSLRCKILTLNEKGPGQHRKYLPYVFTEYGITMLAELIKSEVAVNVSIKIVNSFIEIRKFLSTNGQIF